MEWLGSQGIYRNISSDTVDLIVRQSCEEMIFILGEKGAVLEISDDQIGRVVNVCIDLEIGKIHVKKIIDCLVMVRCNQ